MICETCSKDHVGKFGSGRFCCRSCSNSFSTKDKRKEISSAVSRKLKAKISSLSLVEKLCINCGALFTVTPHKKLLKKKCCSIKCARSLKPSEESKAKNREKRIESILKGNVGYGIKCAYQGIRCDSALEYAFLKWYLEAHPNASIRRFNRALTGESITYIPDFIINETVLVEVKSMPQYVGEFLSKKWKTYVGTIETKKRILENSGYPFMWITEKEIGRKTYRAALKEVKQMNCAEKLINSDDDT